MNKFSSTLILMVITQIVYAQYQIGLVPRVSPDKAVFQKIGYTEMEIKYGSPAIKNRQVWGNLVAYDKVWRAGANNATTIEFNNNIVINNRQLDSGKYAFFVIPKENNKWTIIFNKEYKQWGAFKYNEKEDALRIDIIPRRSLSQTENLSYTIKQLGYQYGSITLNWGYLEIEVPFETNYLKKFEQEVEAKAKKQPEHLKWIVYVQGAEHLFQLRFNLDLALSWINQAENIMNLTLEWNEQFYPREYVKGHLYWTKAKLLAKSNNFLEALEYGQKLKNTTYYDRKNDKESIDVSLALWKER